MIISLFVVIICYYCRSESDHRASTVIQRSETMTEQLEAMEAEVLALRERITELENAPHPTPEPVITPVKVKTASDPAELQALTVVHEREKQRLRIHYNQQQRSHNLQVNI